MTSLDLVALGEPMYEFSQIPGQPRHYLQGFGGDTTNCAIAAARQGASVAYITKLGNDSFGREFLSLWESEAINASGVRIDPQGHTAVYFINHDDNGHVFSYLRKGSAASRLTPDDLPIELIRSARFFHTSGITQAISTSACETVFAAINAARGANVAVSFDANIRPRLWPLDQARQAVKRAIALSDLFLLSVEDAEFLGAPKVPTDILNWCRDLGARRVVLKLGAEGAVACDARQIFRVAGHMVSSIDATGAGDCFAGALLARLARGDKFPTALRYANAAAALTTTDFGAIAPLPRADAVTRFLAPHLP
jgi:2-dehydro-3-deoxygluconokinase